MSSRKSPAAVAAPLSPEPAGAARIKSRRVFLFILSSIFALWVAMMLMMYFGTVYPQRHPAMSPTSNLTDAPAR